MAFVGGIRDRKAEKSMCWADPLGAWTPFLPNPSIVHTSQGSGKGFGIVQKIP